LSPQKLTTFFSRRTQLRPKLTTQPLPPFFPPSKNSQKTSRSPWGYTYNLSLQINPQNFFLALHPSGYVC